MFESGDGLAPLSPRGGRGEEGVGLENRLLPPAPEAPRAGGAGSSVPGARTRRVRGAGAAGRGRGGRRGPGWAGPGRWREGSYCSAAGPGARPATRSRQAAGSGGRAVGRRKTLPRREALVPARLLSRRTGFTRGVPERLLLFGEEAESLLLVFLAEAGVGAGDGG